MPNQATIILKDGATVPANRSFSPVNVNSDGVAKYSDRSGGILIGNPVITLQPKEATKQNRSSRVNGKIALPILEQGAGATGSGFTPAPTVAYTLYFNFDFALPDRCTRTDRANIAALGSNLVASEIVRSLVVDGEFIS